MKTHLNENSFTRWLRRVSVQNKFLIIIGLIIFILLFELGNFWLSMRVASGLRAYVAGEGLWSKAQKAADNSLIKYSTSFDEADYNSFLALLNVPMGDKKARLELEKPSPDYVIVDQGFLAGGNNPEDINDMRFLYRRFRHVSYMDQAIQFWTQGDNLIERLANIGEQIHSYVNDKTIRPGNSAARTAQLVSLTKKVTEIDRQLTILENNFSSTLGEGSRRIRDFLLLLTVMLTILLGAIVVAVASLIRRVIVQVDRAKSEFVSLASHQLRTPLTVVKWQSSSLMEELEKNGAVDLPTLKKYTGNIYLTAQRMIQLVNAILNVSKIDLGTLGIQPEPTSLKIVVEKLLEELQPEINSKHLQMSCFCQDKLPLINIDPKLMRVVVLNLLTNSIKYTPDGGKVTVKLEANHYSMMLTVADTGCGISVKEQNKIFSKFFRTEAARKIDPNGNGLGMYIVRAIVQETMGKIWFESIQGKGTIFYVELPLNGAKPRPGIKDLTETHS